MSCVARELVVVRMIKGYSVCDLWLILHLQVLLQACPRVVTSQPRATPCLLY